MNQTSLDLAPRQRPPPFAPATPSLPLDPLGRLRPTKGAILAALGLALRAALALEEPHGLLQATGALAGWTWRAAEARDDSADLGQALLEGATHADVTLRCTAGHKYVRALWNLWGAWDLATPGEPCDCAECMAGEARRTARGLATNGRM